MPPVQLLYMAGVILPFTMIHISCHEAFQSLWSTLYMSGLHLIDKLTSWTRVFPTLYFTLKLLKWSLTARAVTKVTTSNSLKGGTIWQNFLKRGHVPLMSSPVPPPMKQSCFSYLCIMFSLLFLSLHDIASLFKVAAWHMGTYVKASLFLCKCLKILPEVSLPCQYVNYFSPFPLLFTILAYVSLVELFLFFCCLPHSKILTEPKV